MSIVDETSDPPLRAHIGRLLAACACAEIAVAHVRVAALDLTPDETRSVRRCRILLGRLDASSLSGPDAPDPAADGRLHSLVAFLRSGRAEIRSAGVGAWAPDFSIYRGGTRPDTCLIGAHYFRDPVASNGPSFTVLLADAQAAGLALARFDALWERGHDVLEPVLSALRRRQSFSAT